MNLIKLIIGINTQKPDHPIDDFDHDDDTNSVTIDDTPNESLLSQNKNIGENGTAQLTVQGIGDPRVALFSGICRDVKKEKIEFLINECLTSDVAPLNELIRDIFLIMFEKRDCRGGEKEKKIFYDMYKILVQRYPLICRRFYDIIPEYGCWRDLWEIADENDRESLSRIYKVYAEQLLKDYSVFENEGKGISLACKWAPTEGSKYHKKLIGTFEQFLSIIFPLGTKRLESYRKKNSPLREHLKIVETLMCSNRYDEIDPSKVPSVCALRSKDAFLNYKKTGPEFYDMEKGNRYPDNEKRVLTRQRFLQAVKNKQIKATMLDPYMLTELMLREQDPDSINLLNQQWESLVEKTRSQINKALESGYKPMNNIIPMIDLSPSMDGKPKTSALGLGIMLTELCDLRYNNTVITFDSDCHVLKLDPTKSFSERLSQVKSIPMGYSTNFYLAMTRLCTIIEELNLVDPDDHPSICILTDEQMDYDSQFGYSSTVDDKIKQMFIDLGIKMRSEGFPRPRTVHWNLRANIDGYPVSAHENNCQTITGYSESLLDLILTGKPEPSPYETMRRKLDSNRYDLVRERVLEGLSVTEKE